MVARWVAVIVLIGIAGMILGSYPLKRAAAVVTVDREAEGAVSLPVARVVWEYPDPVGDDYGPGSYVYPTHYSLARQGLFDLTGVRIWEWGDQWIVDVQLVEAKPAWRVPEGFLHQVVDIYVDTVTGTGTRDPMVIDGPQVRFQSDFAWEYRIKLAPWGKSALYSATGDSLPLEPRLLPDGRTIRTAIRKEHLEGISSSMRVIAWVGGYHSLGPDHYRTVRSTNGTWHFGGAKEGSEVPKIVDLLAPSNGKLAQEKQLTVEDQQELAVLYPVEVPQRSRRHLSISLVVIGSLFLLFCSVLICQRPSAKG